MVFLKISTTNKMYYLKKFKEIQNDVFSNENHEKSFEIHIEVESNIIYSKCLFEF